MAVGVVVDWIVRVVFGLLYRRWMDEEDRRTKRNARVARKKKKVTTKISPWRTKNWQSTVP